MINLINAKIGNFLECTRLYPQSKKYTIGNQYEIIRIDMIYVYHKHEEQPHIVIRDDKNKLTRINQISGISYTDFKLKC
jgi:predicted restriction endonuclease